MTTIPTIAAESATIKSELEGALSETIPATSRSALQVLADSIAGTGVSIRRYSAALALDMFAAHASYEEIRLLGRSIRPLLEIGRMLGTPDPVAAQRAELSIAIDVTNQTGSLPAGTPLTSDDNGVTYVTRAAVPLSAATVAAQIVAVEDQNGGGGYGVVGNLPDGAELTFASTQTNVSPTVTVVITIRAGGDPTPWETYRRWVLSRRRTPPKGGAYSDYWEWARSVHGIIDAYPRSGDPGVVQLYVSATEASSGSADLIPTTTQVDAVRDYILATTAGKTSRKPINDGVEVYPISRIAIDLVVTGLAGVDEVPAQAAVEDAADEFLRSRKPFIVGFSPLPRLDRITRAEVSGVVAQVIAALGGTLTAVDLSISATPTVAYTLGFGEEAKLGALTFE